jgi:hypothetical protein
LVDNKTKLALADWTMVGHSALLVEVAAVRSTGVDALTRASVAGSGLWAVLVCGATFIGLRWGWRTGLTVRVRSTLGVGSTDEALWTFTARLVDDNTADGVVTTGSSEATWVYALTLVA